MEAAKKIFTRAHIIWFLLLNFGLVLLAAGIHFFKSPNNFAMGGTSGISIIVLVSPHCRAQRAAAGVSRARGDRGLALLFGGALVLCLGAGARRAHGPPVYGRHVPGTVLRRYPACGGQRYYF